MNSTYKEALIDTIDEMCGNEKVDYVRELATAGVMILAIVAMYLFVIAL